MLQETLTSNMCPQPTLDGLDIPPLHHDNGEVLKQRTVSNLEVLGQTALIDTVEPTLF